MASFFLDTSTNTRYYTGVSQVEYNSRIYVRPTAAVYTGLGFSEITIAVRPNDNFYIVTGPDDSGAYTSTARDLTETKAVFVDQQKTQALGALSNSNWYAIRYAELGTAIPSNVVTYRAAVRTAWADNDVLINAAANIAALETLIGSGLNAYPDPL